MDSMKQNNGAIVPREVISAPNNPADAFEKFVEMIRQSSVTFDVPPNDIFCLLRPFIINPGRNEAAVREIADAYGAAKMSTQLRQVLEIVRMIPFMGNRLKGTIEQNYPTLVQRLRTVEKILKTDLRPGSVTVRLKPIQYLDTPEGYGPPKFHRYRFGVQTVVDPSPDDALDAVSVQFTATADSAAEVVVDAITPQPGFSAVGLKKTGGAQVGTQETLTDTQTIGAELSAGGAKVSSGLGSTQSLQQSTLISVGTEQSLARVEQYLIARKVGNRALWRVLAGVGPIDAGGTEYVADLLIPDQVRKVLIRVEAKVEWMHSGAVPTDVQELLTLPHSRRVR